MRVENQKIEGWLGDAAKNEIFLNGELEARDMAIATLQTELDKIKAELEERDMAIAKLKAELEARGEVKQLSLFPPEPTPTPSPEPEIIKPESNPKPESNTEPFNSNQKVKVKSPAVNPEPEPIPEPITEIPVIEPEPINTTGTLNRGELVKHILENFPDSKINGQKITDAIAGKSKNLPKFEREYGFKYLGKIKGENRFQLV